MKSRGSKGPALGALIKPIYLYSLKRPSLLIETWRLRQAGGTNARLATSIAARLVMSVDARSVNHQHGSAEEDLKKIVKLWITKSK